MAKENQTTPAKNAGKEKKTPVVTVPEVKIPEVGTTEKRKPGRPKTKEDTGPKVEYQKNEAGELILDKDGNPIPVVKKKGRPPVPGSKRQIREMEKLQRMALSPDGKLKKGRPKMDPSELEKQRAEAKARKLAEREAKIAELRELEAKKKEIAETANAQIAQLAEAEAN